MLADKLDAYKEKGNKYVEDHIKPYKVSSSSSATTTKSSFIDDKVKNLMKYMKFV